MAQAKEQMAGIERDPTKQSVHPESETNSTAALRSFLDRIPISSLPGINNAQVLELGAEHSVKDAVRLLYKNDVSGAPIADALSDTAGRFSDRYIGFIDLASLVLWSLEEFDKDDNVQAMKEHSNQNNSHSGFFTMLDQNPRIGQTKVSELAKSFLWDPFLPVRSEDSLFHVLLLLSKHHLQVLPVVEASGSRVIGFVTQNAVIQFLLQSSGLEWFDSVSDRALSEHRHQTIPEALHTLRKNQRETIAVLDQTTRQLVGCIQSSDIHILLDDDRIFHNRKTTTVEDFIHTEPPGKKVRADPMIDQDFGSVLKAGVLGMKTGCYPKMDSPITCKKSDTLKQVMMKLAEGRCDYSFLVDDAYEALPLRGVLTSRDIITKFVPPSMDSSFRGGHGLFKSAMDSSFRGGHGLFKSAMDSSFRGGHGLFKSALEQTGCHVEDGQLVCDN